MPQEANHSPHSAYVINDHLVWIPRYPKKVLVGSVEARLKDLLAEIATPYGYERMAVEVTPALACGASVPDHVHLFVSAPPKFSPAEIVRLFKGSPSRRLKKNLKAFVPSDCPGGFAGDSFAGYGSSLSAGNPAQLGVLPASFFCDLQSETGRDTCGSGRPSQYQPYLSCLRSH